MLTIPTVYNIKGYQFIAYICNAFQNLTLSIFLEISIEPYVPPVIETQCTEFHQLYINDDEMNRNEKV